jgi:PKD repeat protein/type 1 glutamine amidotransferase
VRRSWRAPLRALVLTVAILATAAVSAQAAPLSPEDRPILGSDQLGPSTDTLSSTQAEAYRFKAKATNPVDAINVFVANGTTAGWVSAGIYADNGNGHPGARLGQGTLSRPDRGAWNTVAMDNPVSLEEGKTYWIGVIGHGGILKIRTYSGGKGTDDSETHRDRGFDELPAVWRTGTVFKKDGPLSAYAVDQFAVLVFTKNATNTAVTQAVAALRGLPKADEITFTVTDNAAAFTDANLAKYRTVVFLSNTGDVLSDDQQAAFERYVKGGNGFVGVHEAGGAEPGWSFYGDLVGARPTGASDVAPATIKVADRVHPGTSSSPDRWNRSDRWLNYDSNVRGFKGHVVATVDENTYTGGTMGFDHPIAWCRDFQGGRSYYTGLGSTASSFGEPLVQKHLLGAIEWTAGIAEGDCGATILSNYEMTVLARNPGGLDEPIGFDVLPDGRVLETARLGQLHLIDPANNTNRVIANFSVYNNSEDGLYGPAIDREFATNKWVYLYYAPVNMEAPYPPQTPNGNAPGPNADPTTWDAWKGYFQLSRFKFVDDPGNPHLDMASEQKILKVGVDRGACCHVAGDIAFDSHNNLWLVTGDDTAAGSGNSGGFSPHNDMKTAESQTIRTLNATGGTFTLSFQGQTTAPIAFNATVTTIQSALEALSTIGTGNIKVATQQGNGVQIAAANTTVNVGNQLMIFRGTFGTTDQPQITADASGLTGTNPTAPVNTVQQGNLFQPPSVDASRSAQNTNDLRGKLLRIKVNPDGSYSVPAGNLFAPGTPQTRPEIYAMGFRNPFRISLDADDVPYLTDYSPDSQVPENFRGPAGTGRVEIVRKPANYGWPLCYSPDLPYYRWNFNTSDPLDSPAQTYECNNPTRGPQNVSSRNTGLEFGPPITKPDIWYSYRDNNAPPTGPLGTPCLAYYNGSGGTCPQTFPELASGGVGPHGAAPYTWDPNNTNPTKFPQYWDNAFIFGEFTRDYLREIRLDDQGGILKINNTLPCGQATSPTTPFLCDTPMDMEFAEDGTYYLLTYGDGFFRANPDAKLVRFEYVKGTKRPNAVASATPTSGAAPLTVHFSSAGSSDPEGQSITFAWDFDGNGTTDSTDPNPTFTYAAAGTYQARLAVTNTAGKVGTANVRITVGNTEPTVVLTTPVDGGFFSWGEKIPYTITVTDPEDGAIDCNRVELTFALGHDQHGHAENTQTGCTGTYQTDPNGATHAGGYLYGGLTAAYTDNGGLRSIDQAVVQVKRQEMEFLPTLGTAPAFNADGNGAIVESIDPGDWISLDPVNFTGITGVNLRVAGGAVALAGTVRANIELRLNAPDGPLAATLPVINQAANNTFQTQSVPLPSLPTGTNKLYFVFRATGGAGQPTAGLFTLSWLEFTGPGVSTP